MSERFNSDGSLRGSVRSRRAEAMAEAEARAAANRARGESRTQTKMPVPTLTYPWQKDAFEAWQHGGRSGIVALSPGLPMGDLPYAVIADLVNASQTTNVLIATAAGEADDVVAALTERFGRVPTRLLDHHFLEPRDDGSLVVADLEELRTVDLSNWGRFSSTGLLVLLDADGVGPELGGVLLKSPFISRFCLSRQPSAMDLLVSRPWAPGFGPLLYRHTEAQARDLGVLPRIHYRLNVEILRPEKHGDNLPEGPWDPNDVPTRVPPTGATPFARGKARDVASARAEEREHLIVIHDGSPIRAAAATVPMAELPTSYETVPSGWLMADPSLGVRDLLRTATIAFKATGSPGHLEDVVVLPVPADLCHVRPWEDRWRSTARQLDRVAVALLLADEPAVALAPEDMETLVGVALALRGLPAEALHDLSPIVAEAAEAAHDGVAVPPSRVHAAGRAHGGLAAALLVAAESGPADLLRIAHPGFTPTTPDLPHVSLYDARRHAWRGRAFAALAHAANKDLVTAWGRYPELRFVFPSSLLLEAATRYCKRHRLKGPLDDHSFVPIEDRTKIDTGDLEAAREVLKEWSDALGIAEEHERAFLARMHDTQPDRERRREGIALTGLRVRDKDRDSVTFETQFGRFPATNIGIGSEVAIVAKGDRKELGRGIVGRLYNRRITIECPNGTPFRLPSEVTVNLVFDAKVFEAYHSATTGAVRAIETKGAHDDGPDGLLRAALLGEVAPPKPQKQSLDIEGLTESQRASIESVLAGGRVRLIHGPPGTGKTHTLAHLAMALTRAGHSVLVTADSNAAVDNLAVGLRRNGALVVRVGHAPNIRDEAAQACRVDPLDAPRFVRWAAEQGIVVATTNYGAFRYLDARNSMSSFVFDYIVHDEAGQSTAPSSLAAVMRGRRLVLAGDPLQLPPTVVSMDAKDAGLDVTLFERIEALTGRARTQMLKTQFRSKAPIMAFSSERYYEGAIETADVADAQEGLEEIPTMAFQHVTGRENPRLRNGSISNDWEVEAVVAVVEQIRSEARDKGWTVAVLTPYQAQRERLRRRLGDVEVSTVDGAQGREWDVVLYSAVRSNPRHRLGFLSDERRLNVAVTRARRNFILIGDERTLRDHDGFGRLIDGCEKIQIRYPRPAPSQKRRPANRGKGGPRGGRGGGPSRRKSKTKAKGGGPAAGDKSGGDGGGNKGRRRHGRGRGGSPGPKGDGEARSGGPNRGKPSDGGT